MEEPEPLAAIRLVISPAPPRPSPRRSGRR
jgi:hypothetical protein